MSLFGPQRLLVDACIPKQVVDALRLAGHDVTWAWELIDPRGDLALLALADAEDRDLMTLDTYLSDGCSAKWVLRHPKPGVIWLRPTSIPELVNQALKGATTIPSMTWTMYKPRFVIRPGDDRKSKREGPAESSTGGRPPSPPGRGDHGP